MILGRYQSFNDIDEQAIKSNISLLDFNIGENVYFTRLISSINLTDGFYIKSLNINGENIINIGYREYASIAIVEVLIND